MRTVLFIAFAAVASAHAAEKSPVSVMLPAAGQVLRIQGTQGDSLGLHERQAFQVSASSWAPQSMAPRTLIQDATEFGSTALPRLSADYFLSSYRPMKTLIIVPKTGLAFQDLKREGTVRFPSGSKRVAQDLSLIQARIGTEVSSPSLSWRQVEPYLSLSFLPTVAVAPRSSFENAWTKFGVPLEASLGTNLFAGWITNLISPTLNGATIDFGLTATFGRFQDLNFFGAGLQGGLRVFL